MKEPTELKKDNQSVSQNKVKEEKNSTPGKIADKKKGAKPLKSSALVAASLGRSAVDAVQPTAGTDVKGTSGLTNSGPVVNYEDK